MFSSTFEFKFSGTKRNLYWSPCRSMQLARICAYRSSEHFLAIDQSEFTQLEKNNRPEPLPFYIYTIIWKVKNMFMYLSNIISSFSFIWLGYTDRTSYNENYIYKRGKMQTKNQIQCTLVVFEAVFSGADHCRGGRPLLCPKKIQLFEFASIDPN